MERYSDNYLWRNKQIEWNKESKDGQWWNDNQVNWNRYFITGSGYERILIRTGTRDSWTPDDDKGETCSRCGMFIYQDRRNSIWRHQNSNLCKLNSST